MEVAQNQMDRVTAQAQRDFGAHSLRNVAGTVAGTGAGAAFGLDKNYVGQKCFAIF